jgi:hypothetical protein
MMRRRVVLIGSYVIDGDPFTLRTKLSGGQLGGAAEQKGRAGKGRFLARYPESLIIWYFSRTFPNMGAATDEQTTVAVRKSRAARQIVSDATVNDCLFYFLMNRKKEVPNCDLPVWGAVMNCRARTER